MHDLVAGRYRLPWEEQVVHTDDTSCGFPYRRDFMTPATSGQRHPGNNAAGQSASAAIQINLDDLICAQTKPTHHSTQFLASNLRTGLDIVAIRWLF